MSAYNKALREAEEFVRENPEFKLPETKRLETGETGKRERSDYLTGRRDGYGVESYGAHGDLTDQEYELTPVWPPAPRTKADKAIDVRVEKLMRRLPVRYQNLLTEYYWERLTLEEMAAERQVSYQAVQQQLETAKREFVRAMVKFGEEIEVCEEEL